MNNYYLGNRDKSFRDGFLAGVPLMGAWQTLVMTSGTVASLQRTDSCGGFTIKADASGSGYRVAKQQDTYHCLVGGNAIVACNMMIPMNITVVRFGLHDGGGSGVTDGVYFECNSTNNRYDMYCASNTTITTKSGPARDGNWHEFAIEVRDQDTARFFIDGVFIDSIATNLPFGVAGRSISCWSVTAKKETAGSGGYEDILHVRMAEGRYMQAADGGLML